ncbi:unnamed protein product [Rotaria socialis]
MVIFASLFEYTKDDFNDLPKSYIFEYFLENCRVISNMFLCNKTRGTAPVYHIFTDLATDFMLAILYSVSRFTIKNYRDFAARVSFTEFSS